MAVFTSGTTFPIDFTTLDLTGLRDGDILSGSTSTSFRIDELDGTIDTLTGIGFTFDAFGDPTGGTVTGWKQEDGGTLVFNLTGANDSLATLSGFIDALDTNGFLSTLASGADSFTGSPLADHLIGYASNDTITGGAGADTLDGGAGIDTAGYTTSSVGVFATQKFSFLNTGDAAGDSFISIENMIGSGFDDIVGGNDVNNNIDGGLGADWLFGFLGADTLTGGGGDDTLNGGAGADSLNGGSGFDLASYKVLGTAGVKASLTDNTFNTGDAVGDVYTSIEGLRGTNFNDTLEGDAGANKLFGASGDDSLTGGAGADTLIGGAGTDTASFATSSVGIFATQKFGFLNDGDAAGDTFTSIENMVGSSFDDILGGNDGANNINGGSSGGADWLFGFAGDDTLIGGAGADTLNGGAGADRLDGGFSADIASYNVLGTAGVHASLFNPSFNTGDAAGDIYISIEGLKGTNFGDFLEGNGNANTLIGAAGADTLIGGAGADTLMGGKGTDELEGGAGADSLDGGGGFDVATYTTATSTVIADLATEANGGDATGDTYTSIEGLIGSGFADNLSGDGLNNLLVGNGGNDTILGGGGNDVVNGDAGNDFLFGNDGFDTLMGGAGDDNLNGGFGFDHFRYFDGDGADTIQDFIAGAGTDDAVDLIGVTGINTFADVLAAASDISGSAVIDFGGGNSITLLGVSVASLHADDFIIS